MLLGKIINHFDTRFYYGIRTIFTFGFGTMQYFE